MGILTIRALNYVVPEKHILRDIDLEIAPGEIFAIMGMSGSGKTSLLKCMAGLIKPSGGHIYLGDTDIVPLSEPELDSVRLKIGLVFQYAALFDSLTVYDNVAFGLVHHRKLPRREIDRIVRERLEAVGMAGTERLYPSQLSGGMQKRVGLARALAMEPMVLLYDEPTSGLDPVITRNIDDMILQTRERLRMTSVIVSHDIGSIMRIADRVAMLHEGSVIACGTVAEIRESSDPRVQEFVREG